MHIVWLNNYRPSAAQNVKQLLAALDNDDDSLHVIIVVDESCSDDSEAWCSF